MKSILNEKAKGRKTDEQKLYVFDTTLRDGLQTPGVSVDKSGRILIAEALSAAGVDVIEAGFAANDIDFEPMEAIAKYVGTRAHSTSGNVPQICGLARLMDSDIDCAYAAIKPADSDKRRIHVFIGTSSELMSYSHGKREEKVIEMIQDCVPYAKKLVGNKGTIQYSSEDALRTDYDFLRNTIQAAIDGGANVINIPDTTGFADFDKYYKTIRRIKKDVEGIDNAVLSAHIHNDSGNAVATTLKGIEAGVGQAEVTVLGLGERAGNTALEPLIIDLLVNAEKYDVYVSHIDTTMFNDLANLVSTITGHSVPCNQPVVGANAFAVSSGVHTKGVANNKTTYHVVDPALIGSEISVIIGPTSGTHAVEHVLKKLGYGKTGKAYNESQLSCLTSAVKEKSILLGSSLNDTEFSILAEHYMNGKPLDNAIYLKDYCVKESKDGTSVDVVLNICGEEYSTSGKGKGPLDAFMNAINEELGICADLHGWNESAEYYGKGAPGFEILNRLKLNDEKLKLMNLENGTGHKGQKAFAKSEVELLYGGATYHGRGRGQSITRASYESIINAFDAIYRLNQMRIINK